MNQLVPWNPLNELADLLPGRWTPAMRTADHNDWNPVVDITEDDSAYFIKAELPGVKRDDIEVTFENGLLTLRGERKFEREEKSRKVHRIERDYGSFERTFELPDNVDPNQLSARFEDGLLTVTVAKAETAKAKRIEVRVG